MAIDFKRAKAPAPTIELTSLIDIIFQLLIFFMISSSFLYPSLGINLPSIEMEETAVAAQPLTLSLEADGTLHLNQLQLSESALEATLRQKLAEEATSALFFRADRTIPYERVLQTLQIAGKAGVAQLNFIYQSADNSND
jgi:biopolymer transport protein TolR